MKIAVSSFSSVDFNKIKKQTNFDNKVSSNTIEKNNIPSFCALKPLTEEEKKLRCELKKLTPLMRDKNGFSLDKAVELLKNKIDKQLMLYTEDDIKNIVNDVLMKNPTKTRMDVLKMLEKLSSFSNYDSFSKIEDYCKKNNIVKFASTKILTINDVFRYLSHSRKDLIHLPSSSMTDKNRGAIVADRNLVKYLKDIKEKNPQKIEELKENIFQDNIKLVLLDGFEAKTKNGYKSFNFVGNWDDLEKTTDSILKAENDVFNDDIKKDLKEIFGDDISYDVIENKSKNLNEKEIAQRLNSRTISKEDIKKSLLGIALYAVPQSAKKGQTIKQFKKKSLNEYLEIEVNDMANIIDKKNITKDKLVDKYIEFDLYKEKMDEKNRNIVLENTAKIMYLTMDLYSPKKIANELKNLNQKIGTKLQEINKTKNDVSYIVPDVEKSFGLINYQNSKINNINQNQFICGEKNIKDYMKNKNHGKKVYVFLDDFSGSGQSMLEDALYYEDLKFLIKNEPFIFAPLAHTKYAKNKINKTILMLMNDLQKKTNDCFIGGKEVKDANDYIKILGSDKKTLVKYAFDDGFQECYSTVGFPHVIPDNCSDVAGYLLDSTIRNKRANKAKMRDVKRKTIEYIMKKNNKID